MVENEEEQVTENEEAPASENEDTSSVENTETEPTQNTEAQDTENQETTTMNVVAQASNTMEVLIISDEAVLAEQIISDEAVLEEIPAEEIEELEEVIDPVVVSEKAEALSYNISDQKLLLMFTKNKSRFQKVSNGGYDYNDFENAWKELSHDYNSKSEAKKMNQKKVFIEIYLHLSNEQ